MNIFESMIEIDKISKKIKSDTANILKHILAVEKSLSKKDFERWLKTLPPTAKYIYSKNARR